MKTLKNRIAITLLLFIFLLSCVSGCGSRSGSTTEVSTEEALSAYAEYIQQYYINIEHMYYKEKLRYSLVYIDEDNIPELVLIEDSAHANGVHICVYRNGTVIDVAEFGTWGSFLYSPNENIICSSFTGQGVTESHIFRIDGNEGAELQQFLFYVVPGDLPETCLYWVDGHEVSEEEYNEAYDKWNIDEMELFRYEDGILFTTVDNPYEEMIKLLSTL